MDMENDKTQAHPISTVLWVSVHDVEPNEYNPNSVSGKEMQLLHTSISKDGYTQPIVTIKDPERDKYIIVDGFHRWYTCKTMQDVYESTGGMVPIVVLKKSINDRMAATVRHNRARGEHAITGMANIVFGMLENGWSDVDICNNIGMTAEELVKIKHITGFSKLFANVQYSRAWETKNQILLRQSFNKK
jgi:ParB-like nuclease domain